MTVYITTPVKDHHRLWMKEAAGGCRLVYAQDGECAIKTAEIIIGDCSPKELKQAQNLNWFHLVWAGVDRYRITDLPAGAFFTNGSGAYGVTIAEHMVACMLSLYRQLRHYDRLQSLHQWDGAWQEDTLEGKTVLILGTGDIGQALAKRLQGFDCRVLGIRRKKESLPYFERIDTLEQLDDLLPEADVVACCLPGTPSTAGLLNRDRLYRMKPTALLLNCGRGSLIDTKALEQALAENRLGGCALDVTDPEPLPADSPLWEMEHVILTPHISGASFGHVEQMEDRIYRLAAENLRRYLAAEPLLNRVDFTAGY